MDMVRSLSTCMSFPHAVVEHLHTLSILPAIEQWAVCSSDPDLSSNCLQTRTKQNKRNIIKPSNSNGNNNLLKQKHILTILYRFPSGRRYPGTLVVCERSVLAHLELPTEMPQLSMPVFHLH